MLDRGADLPIINSYQERRPGTFGAPRRLRRFLTDAGGALLDFRERHVKFAKLAWIPEKLHANLDIPQVLDAIIELRPYKPMNCLLDHFHLSQIQTDLCSLFNWDKNVFSHSARFQHGSCAIYYVLIYICTKPVLIFLTAVFIRGFRNRNLDKFMWNSLIIITMNSTLRNIRWVIKFSWKIMIIENVSRIALRTC